MDAEKLSPHPYRLWAKLHAKFRIQPVSGMITSLSVAFFFTSSHEFPTIRDPWG